MNIYEQITEWLKTIYSGFGDWLYFNVIRMEDGASSVNSVSGTTVLEKYIDGSTKNELIFAISLSKTYDTEMSELNIDAIGDISALTTAIEESSTLPDLGSDYIVDMVEIVQDIPSVNIYQDDNICEYQIQAKIIYIKKAR